MKWFSRIIGVSTVVIVVVVGLNTVAASWFRDEGGPLQMSRLLLFETRRTQALRHRADMVAQSWQIKYHLIDEVLAGRLSLRQSILQFKQANELIDNDDSDLIAPYYTPTDPESLGKQVLVWVRNEVASWPPSKAQRFLTDLDGEFQEMFGHSFSESSGMSLLGGLPSSVPTPLFVAD